MVLGQTFLSEIILNFLEIENLDVLILVGKHKKRECYATWC